MTGKKSVIEPEMVEIPAGHFLMGCEAGAENERPVHRIWVGSFAIARTATTNRRYRDFLDQTRRRMPPSWDDERFNHPDQPVTGVSWFDAAEYCDWLSACTGKPYRLPTEAEWERAARGGMEGKLYTWGDEPPERQPNYSELWRNGPERVCRRPPNGFGLYEISENVHEWCADWYGDYVKKDAASYSSKIGAFRLPGCRRAQSKSARPRNYTDSTDASGFRY